MDYEYGIDIAFSPDENQVAVLSGSLITVWNINNPENYLLFNPWPSGRYVLNRRVVFQTSNHVVIYTLQRGDDVSDYYFLNRVPYDSYGLLQVWHVTGSTHLFSLDIKIVVYIPGT